MRREHAPRWVDAILKWHPTWILARVAIASAYLCGGLYKLLHIPAAVAEQAHFGLQPAWLWAASVIVVEIGGSLLLVFGCLVWLAAGSLSVLTAVAILVADNFWMMDGTARFAATNTFLEHLGLIGGLASAAIIARQGSR